MNQSGYEPRSGMYFEVLGSPSAPGPPWLFIHGAAGTGGVWQTTPDGRPGWAPRLAQAGRRCWVLDWPGMGRSGGLATLDLGLDDVIEAIVALLREIVREPVVIVAHSMGASVAWRVAELAHPLVAAIIGIAPSDPGNIAPRGEVRESSETEVTVRHPDYQIDLRVPRDRQFLISEETVTRLWTAPSRQFAPGSADLFRHTLVPMPPRYMLQRLGADGGIPQVIDTHAYVGLQTLIVTATEDPTHTPALAQPIVDLLRDWGAEANLLHLGDRGIVGNGHFMFLERNSDDVLDAILSERAPARREVEGIDASN